MQLCCITGFIFTKKTNMKSNIFIYLSILCIGLFTACNPDDELVNDEEVITSLVYTLTSASGDIVTLTYTDADGEGGLPGVAVGGTFQANTTYAGVVQVLNTLEDPAENITEEVEEEDLEHQFFYVSTLDGLSVAYGDEDSEGNPLGIITTLTTGDAGTGTLTVSLIHEPNKSGENVSAGNPANAGGETDIEVSFDIDVQ